MGWLSAIDGVSHFNWTQNLGNCFQSYHGLSCAIGYPFAFNQTIYWLFFFILIFVIMPLFLYYLTKNWWVSIGYFTITGIPWVFDSIGFYSQFILAFFFVFFVYEKNWKKRVSVALVLILLSFNNLFFHAQQWVLAWCVIGIEIILFIFYHFDFKKYFLGLMPFSVDYLRYVGYNKLVTGKYFVPTILYYSYHLLIRPMLFVFSIPAFIHIIVKKDWKKLLWLIVLFGASVYMWFYEAFSNASILRVFVLFGFILMPSFFEWFEKRTDNVKTFFIMCMIVWGMVQLTNWVVFKLG